MYVKSGFIRDTMVALLYALRICGMAPVSIVRKKSGYQFRVLRSYALYGYILISCLITTHAYLYISNAASLKSHIKNNTFNATTFMWITETFTSVIPTIVASLNGYRRMEKFIEHLKWLDKTSAKIKIPRQNGRIYKIIIILVILTRFFLDASYIYILVDNFGIRSLLSYMYVSAIIKYFLICLLQMHIYDSYLEVSLKIGYIKDELQDLVDNRLCDDSTHSFYRHSVDEKVKKLHDLLDNIKTIYLKLNKHFEIIFFFILVNIVIRIILCFYGISYIIQNGFEESSHYWDGSPFWSLGLYGIHNFVTIFVVIQPFRVIACELAYIKLLMGRMMTLKNYAFRIFPNVDFFHKDLISYDFSYTPLGIITIQRSIIIKVLAIGITCLAAILQFQK
ncbi:uncharacterized protein LOC125052019 [Pieris napi]|uniref:uncharacterized protein LOC125052019 n=1 Tax=Pieris napi TaxID=78633 RepID=UPI001FBB3736|nr:uncharacterized protein LOC125052019 [Pieris napi]